MKKINTSQSKLTTSLIWLVFLGGILFTMPVKAQTTVSELQQLINDVPDKGTKVIDLEGKTYQQADMLEITGGRNITLKNGTLLRNNFYSPGTFVHVMDSYLTLESVVVDGNEKNKNTRGPLISLISSELTVKAGTIIKNNDIISKVTAGGVKVDESSSFIMTGGEIGGCYDYEMGQVYVAKGGQFTMTGGTIRSVCTEGNATIGGSAKITSYFRLNGEYHLMLSSALENVIPIWRILAKEGAIAVTATDGYTLTTDDVAKFKDYQNNWSFDLKDGNIICTEQSSTVNSEDELQKKIDAAPVGSTGSPTSISIGNVEITKGVTIDGKYITLTGGSIIGNSSNSWITLKGGGLNLNQINVTRKGSSNGSPVYLDRGGQLIINNSIIDGERALEGAINVGSQSGSIVINQGTIKGIISNMNASLTFNSGSATTIFSKVPVKLSGNVQISGGVSCEIILMSAPLYMLKMEILNQSSNVIASGTGGFILTENYLSMFECIDTEYKLVWKNNQILYEKTDGETPSAIETEDELQKALDAASPGSESAPTIIPIKNVTLTKPLTIDGKYITFNGGNLVSSNSSAKINIKKGGLILDNISLSAGWSSSGKFITVGNNGTLVIRSTATISSNSKDLNLIYIEAGSTLKNEGIITGCISSSGILYLTNGTIHGQVSSFGLFYLSGTVKIDTGVYLSGSAAITMTSVPKYLLQILTDGESSTVVVKGGSGFVLSESYLNKFVCITENWQFIWSNNQILVVKIQSTNYKVTWNIPSGVTVKPESGYNATSIVKGGDFKFTIVFPSNKKVIVKQGSIVITPDANGVYTLTNIQADIVLTITLENKIGYTVTLPSQTGFDIKVVDGYDASLILEGADFKFSIRPKAGYEQYIVKVFVNNTLITPVGGSVYTIVNVHANLVVRIEVTPPVIEGVFNIIWNADEGATLVPESGYDKNTVKPGDDFKFHIVTDALHKGCEILVRVDGILLSPDIWGIYTISNIRSNKIIEITISEVFNITFVKPREDVKMVAETGYNPERVLAGNDFRFRLESKYKANQLQVIANGELLIPVNSVYTIYNVYENKIITVTVNTSVGNEDIHSDRVEIVIRDHKLCIKHQEMKNIPLYITSFGGSIVKTSLLNGTYTEIDIPVKGAYIIFFEGFSQKIVIK